MKHQYKQIFVSLLAIVFMVAGISLLHAQVQENVREKQRKDADLPDARSFWNGTTEFIARDGEEVTAKSTFSAGWVNYLSQDTQTWKPIDTTIMQNPDGSFFMREALFEARFPRRSGGTATMVNNNQYDIFNDEKITEPAMSMRISALGVRDVPGVLMRGDIIGPTALRKDTTYVLYEGAYPDGDLIYYIDDGVAPRLGKLIRFNHEPVQKEYRFIVSYSEPQDFTAKHESDARQWDKQSRFEVARGDVLSIKKPTSDKRGFGMKQFQIWDSNLAYQDDPAVIRNQQPITVMLERSEKENAYILTKILPPEFFANDPTYPVYTDTTTTAFPDPDPETNTVDGHVRNTSVDSWANARGASTGTTANDSDGDVVTARSRFVSPTYMVDKGIFLFDTSAIPSTDTVSSSTISLFLKNKGDGNGDGSINVFAATPASNTSLSTADFDQVGSTAFATARTIASVQYEDGGGNDYTHWLLNSSGRSNIARSGQVTANPPNVSGISAFGFREATYELADSPAPTADSFISAYMAETAGTNKDPKLVVEHVSSDPTAPAAVSDLAAVSGSTTATAIGISWTAPGDDGSTGTATSYDLRYSTSNISEANWSAATQATGEPTPLVAGTSQTMLMTGLTADTTYYFAIKTSDELPNTSDISNIISTTTLDSIAPASSTIAVASTATSSVVISWNAPGDSNNNGTSTTYDLRYSTSNITEANWSSATQVTGEPTPALAETAQSMTVWGLSPSTTYYFALKASDEIPNTSELSNVVSTTTYEGTAPATVSDLTASHAAVSGVRVTWTAPGDDGGTGTATSYDLRYSTTTITEANWHTAVRADGEPTPSIAGSSESVIVPGLSSSTAYYFAIKASDEVPNTAALSNVVSTTTLTHSVSQRVTYTYDDLNRVKTEDHTGKAGTEMLYSYDYCAEGIGHLCSATTTDGVSHYAYYATGATHTERKTIDGADYITQFTYDRGGNQILITYPDGSLVQYNYNAAGQLESVSQKEAAAGSYTDIILDFDYSPLGQVTFEKWKSGVETTNTYDANELYRLKSKTTTTP
jgi:hypothetical protein